MCTELKATGLFVLVSFLFATMNFGYIIIRSLHMKFEFNWAIGLLEN